MERLLIVAFGGAAGAVARYLVGGWCAGRWGADFPYGTLVINVSGSLVLGFVAVLTTERFSAPNIRLLVGVGFLGAYTTFSTYQYESLQMLMEGSTARALLNLFGSLALGVPAAWLGTVLARLL